MCHGYGMEAQIAMGHTDIYQQATELIATVLKLQIDEKSSGGSYFRTLVEQAGIRRVEHCVKLTSLWDKHRTHTALDRYNHLVMLLHYTLPDRRGKYRNPGAEAAKKQVKELESKV